MLGGLGGVRIDPAGGIRKLARSMRIIKGFSREEVNRIADITRDLARSKSPRNTGRMKGLIVAYHNLGPDEKPRAVVVAKNPTKNPPKSYRDPGPDAKFPNGVFNLVKWFHTVGTSRTGEAQFMFNARDQINRRAGQIANSDFRRIDLNK